MAKAKNAQNARRGAKAANPARRMGSTLSARPGLFANACKQADGECGEPVRVVDPAVYAVSLPIAFAELFDPHRYKVFYGGRGGAKSWTFADALVTIALERRVRVLCGRELQVSIADSVHRLLVDRINARGLDPFFQWTNTGITSVTGSEFLFKGLRHNISEIKSLEGIDICWVEEAQKVSKASWELLIPTIRKEGSEIWLSFNPGTPYDETWQRFVVTPPHDAIVRKVTYRDNPWFSATLEAERAYAQKTLPLEDYLNIWEGVPKVSTQAQVFRGRYAVEAFETPENVRLFYGADWGFAADPTTLVRAFVRDDELFIDYEAWAKGIELENLHTLFDTVPGARRWTIVADSSRPEIIKSMRRRGFIVKPSKKWPGSVEEGVTVLRSFRRIVVHPRCGHVAEEMRLYSYKVDSLTEEVLPMLVDKDNHCIDALRYGLEPVIRGKIARRAS